MSTKRETYPILPLRDIVVLPHMTATLFVGRPKSISALHAAMQDNKKILLVVQKESAVDDPLMDDLYTIGTLGVVTQMINLVDGTVKVLVEGLQRARVHSVSEKETHLMGVASMIPPAIVDEDTLYVLDKILLSEFEQYAKYNKKITAELLNTFIRTDDYEKIIDTMSVQLMLTIHERQELLEALSLKDRIELLLLFIRREIEALKTEDNIRKRIKSQMTKNHREYYLQEQLKAIQKELHADDGKDELTLLEKKIKSAGLSKEALEKAESEIKKLRHMNPMSAEATVVRNYLEWMVDLPWKKVSRKSIDIKDAETQLDRDHFGLEKVKERIMEFLVVQERVGKVSGQVLCFVGAPGVGKTSLARSIAAATGRPFVRMALGGVRDESEIRGHRRTYIGALPGKILQNMKKAKATNPVFLLDEIDKLGADWRGDPSSALLEVLDPEQNKTFNDHYLEVDYDLSNVIFIATANTLNLPRPLLDRLEVIRIEGYTEDEKRHIALNHLVEKKRQECGLKKGELVITEDALNTIIRFYTREAGVRHLERKIFTLCRKAVMYLSKNKAKSLTITAENVHEFLGVPPYSIGLSDAEPQVGTCTGLAWTEVGGDILSIEVVQSEGKGKITITGKLGDVMKESIHAAFSFIKSRGYIYGIHPSRLSKIDIHVHVPEGATPKDGPSAGIAIATAIVSVLTGIPVLSSVAMTGEITLRGRVLAIGGLKEKLLAALRGGIKTVLIPKDNVKDLADVPPTVKESLNIIPVSILEDVLPIALARPLTPISDDLPSMEMASGLGFSGSRSFEGEGAVSDKCQ